MLFIRRENNTSTEEENYFVEFDQQIPPEVLLDTHIWLNMSKPDEQVLHVLRNQKGFRFRYSITNYIELLSQLAKGPTKKRKNPFSMVRGAFRKIKRLCEPTVLPSPEMAHLEGTQLLHYLHPAWTPNLEQTALAVDLIANANTEGDITGIGIQTPATIISPRWVIDPRHFLMLTQTDDQSIVNMLSDLKTSFQPGTLAKSNIDKLTPWFQNLATFFFALSSQ